MSATRHVMINIPVRLYLLNELDAAQAPAKFIFCEGEKAAVAGAILFPSPGTVTTTVSGGADGIKSADLTPCQGRSVWLFQDNDQPGDKWVSALRKALRCVGALKNKGKNVFLNEKRGGADKSVDDPTQFPNEEKRPCYQVYQRFIKNGKRKWPPGVYYHGIKTGRNGEAIEINIWICSPLWVEAIMCDQDRRNFGRVVRFINTNGAERTWSMPMEMLRGSCEELRGQLLNMGVEIDPRKRQELPVYIQSQHPDMRRTIALDVGWYKNQFVMPERVIGDCDDVVFQSDHAWHDEYKTAGSLDEWRTHVASICPGNPLLILAVSAAFAGPLLKLINLPGAGFHIYGPSSTGKSTGQQAAGSVWGGENFRRTWRATANGIESVASLFNDSILCLDELSEADPREVRQVAYFLHNGVGKQRGGRIVLETPV